MDTLQFFPLKPLAFFIIVSTKCYSAQENLQDEKYFKKVTSHGDALPQGDVISSYLVDFQLECSFKCLLEGTCVAYNYRNTNERDSENCQLSNKEQKRDLMRYGDWMFYQDEQDMKMTENDTKPNVKNKTHFCPANFTASSLQIRLNGTANNYSGRVEIFHPTFGWGTVCDDTWHMEEGNVTCRQLGFTGARAVRHWAYYGEGSGPILLDNVSCTGNECHLWNCTHNGWNKHNCKHKEDAGVECY